MRKDAVFISAPFIPRAGCEDGAGDGGQARISRALPVEAIGTTVTVWRWP